MTGADLTRWTIWLATACYFARWICELWPSKPGITCSTRVFARLFWTAACILLWVHVGVAFHVYHHWSHAAAVEHNLQQTRAIVGIEFGGGVWINYAIMVLWLGDALWWWLDPESFARRPRWISILWHGFLAFIGINATVVFATGPIRWGTLAGVLVVIICAFGMREMQNAKCKM